MAYLNKIDINGRTYYLQHLTDGKYEAKLPALENNYSTLIVRDSYSGNIGDSDTPVYIVNDKVKPLSSNIGNEVQFVYMKRGSITASTSTVGSNTKPIYMKDGAITEFTNTIGSDIQPVYINEGEITASNSTVGSGITPIYMQDGTITASTNTVGSVTKPVYLDNGTITESSATVGSGVKPVYMDGGKITESNNTVGSDIKPIYLNSGVITVSDGNVGSKVIPVYMVNGTITQTTETVGSSIKPIYMNNGAITASTSTVGAINQPIYMNGGEIVVCSDNVGNVGVPVYMANGVITACSTIPISSGGTGATTKKEALENLGLTATAAELNTLDGITASVEELNYVDGVTSNIQTQFNNQDQRIKTNSDAIATLNGSGDGSVAKAVADAKTGLEAEIAKKVDKIDGKGLSDENYTADEKTKLSGIENGANKYVHPSYNAAASGLYKITVDEFGHVSSVVAVSKDDIVGLGIPEQDTTYGNATTDTSGLLSATDKATYDGYAATIESLQSQINALKELVESYHTTTE